jgi:hypothetical protein
MPLTYLPPVTKRSLAVIWQGDSRFVRTEWAEDAGFAPTRQTVLAGRVESVLEMWERDLVQRSRLTTWKFTHYRDGDAVVSVAEAEPTWLTTAERIDMLLSRIFSVSCRAAERGDWDEVARLDARYDRIDHAYYHTPVG